MIKIREYNNNSDREQVINLWKSIFNYKDARNDPGLSIDNKLKMHDNLFLVAESGSAVSGTIMGGYDGHRGWIYSLAVLPGKRNQKIGSKLLLEIENRLSDLGCLKINLQILNKNEKVKLFYEKNGYKIEERISMGKQITKNIPDYLINQPGTG